VAAREIVTRGTGRDTHRPGYLAHGQPGVLPGERQFPAEVWLGGDPVRIRLLSFGG
jgi:hypothetical protein